MEHIVNQRIICGLTIPDGIRLTMDGFTFLPDFEGEHQVRHIQIVIEANTKEEAVVKASKLFNDFLAKLTLIDSSKYILENELFVSPIGMDESTTHTVAISTSAFITQDGNRIKSVYEGSIKGKLIRKRPIRLYRDAVNAGDLFEKYRNFYRVLECYGGTTAITDWIKKRLGNPEMKKNNKNKDITIYTWIRHKLSHSKREVKDLEPFLISNPEHVSVVRSHLPKIQELAREKIKQEEGI